jgi:hypothetical protein
MVLFPARFRSASVLLPKCFRFCGELRCISKFNEFRFLRHAGGVNRRDAERAGAGTRE